MEFKSDDEMLDSLWVEKYRPTNIDDLVLNDEQKEFMTRCLEKGEVPHCGFFGPAGSGKCHDGDELIDIFIDDD